MLKLLRHPSVTDSPLPFGDVFMKAQKEPHPVVRPPMTEITPRSPRIPLIWASFSLSQSSPASLVHSEAEESLTMATTSNAQPSRWSLSRSSSLRPTQMLKSRSEGDRQSQRIRLIDDRSASERRSVASSSGPAKLANRTTVWSLDDSFLPRATVDDRRSQRVGSIKERSVSERASVTSSSGSARYANNKTLWSTDDSFLPRSRPPPPLKRIKHKRNRSESDTSHPELTTSTQPSMSHHSSCRQSSISSSAASHSPPPCSDMLVLDILKEESSMLDVQSTLTGSDTPVDTASETSHITDIPSSSSRWKWEPPMSWAGPSRVVPAGKDDGLTQVGDFLVASKKNVESGTQGSSKEVLTRLGRVRSFKRLKPIYLSKVGELEEEVFDAWRERETVKIQCYENNEWHEKPVADVIPMLRELKIK